jgi:hypothetical protein
MRRASSGSTPPLNCGVSGQRMLALRTKWLLLIWLAGPGSPAWGCSVAPDYDVIDNTSGADAGAVRYAAPAVTIERFVRGRKGWIGSCADLGYIALRVPVEPLAFRFEIVDGSFRRLFPYAFVQPRRPGALVFFWTDGNSDEQKPIRLVVKVTSLSSNGVLSDPQFITIEDPGRNAIR